MRVSFISFNIEIKKVMKNLMKRITKKDQQIAIDSLREIQVLSQNMKFSKENGIKIKVQEAADFITIPKKALLLLHSIIQNMAEGKTISIVPSNSEVSTQQAADILNMSRPHLVKLLENKIIPFKKVGSHRRVFLKDILTYKENFDKQREDQLNFLSKQAQDLNLGYE